MSIRTHQYRHAFLPLETLQAANEELRNIRRPERLLLILFVMSIRIDAIAHLLSLWVRRTILTPLDGS
jgi:hypothetical protein